MLDTVLERQNLFLTSQVNTVDVPILPETIKLPMTTMADLYAMEEELLNSNIMQSLVSTYIF
jgi:hypothetical protein